MDQDLSTPGVQTLVYPNTTMFINGSGVSYDGTVANIPNPAGDLKYTKVDQAAWDMAQFCGSCHVGGGMVEHDRNDRRLSYLKTGLDGAPADTTINPFTYYVQEDWNNLTGAPNPTAVQAPWSYSYPLPGMPGFQMPNVREMDCLFCHLRGYKNLMSSVAVQMGVLNAAPSMGAGFINPMTGQYDIFAQSPTQKLSVAADPIYRNATSSTIVGYQNVRLSDQALASIMAKPDSQNCKNCHANNSPWVSLVDFMKDGLAQSPTSWDANNYSASNHTGLVMPSWDFNAPFSLSLSMAMLGQLPTLSGNALAVALNSAKLTSPVIYPYDPVNTPLYQKPAFDIFPQAYGPTAYNALQIGTPYDPPFNKANGYKLGGGNPGMSGPIYFESFAKDATGHTYYMSTTGPTTDLLAADIHNAAGQPVPMFDQNALKRGMLPFPRADWFKRGDYFDNTKEVHNALGCAGCHFTGSPGKNQCDPGRGFDFAGGVENGTGPIPGPGIDTRNTVLRCENCHVPANQAAIDRNPSTTPIYKSADGRVLTDDKRYYAVNPTSNHKAFGLYSTGSSPKVQAVGMNAAGTAEVSFVSRSHLDVMDCTVCHVQKITMAVRTLDCTSGNRYPALVGTDPNAGMMGMFIDPMTVGYDSNGERIGMRAANGMIGSPSRAPLGGDLQEWIPLRNWEGLGNGPKKIAGVGNKDWRRRIQVSNMIVSALWNNEGDTVDANGDGVVGHIITANRVDISDPATENFTYTAADGSPKLVLDPNARGGAAALGASGSEPIYDPWIMRDLKAGLNFAPSGFDPIPVGFGQGAFQSAYDQDGLFTGAWQYVSIYGGAITPTTPEEIAGYKTFRTSMGQDWSGTRLTSNGGAYRITHGTARPTQFVLGRRCADCHAATPKTSVNGVEMHVANADGSRDGNFFFDGGFVMTGLAIKATAGKNMMLQPAEIYKVTALKTDLRTGSELWNKNGFFRNVEYQQEGSWNGATKTFTPAAGGLYAQTTPLDRAEALYPDDTTYTDVNGHTYANRAAWVTYLKNIGAPANAAIASIDPSTTDAIYSRAVTVNTDITLTAQQLGIVVGTPPNPPKDNGPDTTYSWTINDATDANGYVTVRTLPGAVVTTQFTKTGLFTVTLIARNPAGEETKAMQTVYVKPTQTGAGGNLVVTPDTTDPVTTKLTFAWAGGTAPVYDMVKISWGDGGYTQLQTANLGTSITHAYKRLAQYKNATNGYDYKTNFYFYKVNALVAHQEVALDNLVTTSDLVLNARMIRLLDRTTNSYLVRKGSDVYLVVSLFNKGPGTNPITSVTIPAIPAPLSVLSSSANMGSLSGTTWNINRNLAKGQTATLTLKVHMDKDAATTKFNYPATFGALTVVSSLPDSIPAGTVVPPASVTSEPVAGFAVTPY